MKNMYWLIKWNDEKGCSNTKIYKNKKSAYKFAIKRAVFSHADIYCLDAEKNHYVYICTMIYENKGV